MPQDFYTLEEAAGHLNIPKEQLLEISRRGDVRAFLDRGTQRFRKQEIDELGRRMGIGSDTGLQPQGVVPSGTSDIFSFDVASPSDGGSAILKSGSKKPGSDSDVRLVPQGSDIELQAQQGKPSSSSKLGKGPASGASKVNLEKDSDVKLVEDDSSVPLGREKGMGESGVRLDAGNSGRNLDSGVRLVEDRPRRGSPGDSGLLTEELDLDAELRQAEKTAKPPSSKKVIPFEVKGDAGRKAPTPSSSEFELKPSKANEPSDSVFDSSSEQIRLDPEDDSSIHVSASRDLGIGGASGINLHKPSDKGLSLEKGVDDSSGETLALDLSAEDRKKPAGKKRKQAADSSSEFELTLDDDIGLAPMDEDKGSKDVFKTNLGSAAGLKKGDSSGDISLQPETSDEFAETSDFELALDEDSSAVESETGSEVIVIDEDAGEADATALRPDDLEVDDVGAVLEASDEELAVEAAADDDEVSPAGRRVAVEAPPAEWGIWGGVHLLTVLFLIPTGFLLFEMLRSIWGYNKETPAAGWMFDKISNMMK